MNIPRNEGLTVSSEQLSRLAELDVCTICHALVDLGYKNSYMRGIQALALPDENTQFLGFARTLRFLPLREDLVEKQYADNMHSPHRTALESIGTDDVLVIDAGGCMESGVIGDIFTRRVMYLGGRAIVIDGVVRDLSSIRQTGLPVFAKGIHGAGINRYQMSVGVDDPIQCGGVTVVKGDIIMGNSDGVIAVPPQTVDEIVEKYHGTIIMEEWIRNKILHGADLHHYYQHPPLPDVIAEFEQETGLVKGKAHLPADAVASR